MFKKLKLKFVLTNLVLTSVVLFAAYTSVYLIAANNSANRRPIPSDSPDYSSEVENIINEHIKDDRKKALSSLLFTLISTGVATELIVFIISAYLAEEAIKPVKEAYEAQKLFIANASHEIKTPLAAIQANLEAADISGNHWLDNVVLETEKLADLNGKLLTLTKTDLAPASTALTKLDFKDLIKTDLKSFESRLKKENLKLKTSFKLSKPDKTWETKLNKADFSELFGILLDNAIKYSGGKIWLSVSEKELKLKNDGATIPKENLKHVFDRFYQVDKSKQGVGLGLSIAKSLADKNSWKLSVSSDDKTTEFTLSI
ncbi:HAMP domain-containing histidine kinase [Candidatus Saccharibacteria bacterium]|nr:HAMP domain-containing histidine kinase [Candidatus Saccharibacteria bacterium]MBQ6605627.1 HAMP domain-containing histidine kinase [Candidatus Saccharibacteria bacterium]